MRALGLWILVASVTTYAGESPQLRGRIAARQGPHEARQWTFEIAADGRDPVRDVRIDGLEFTQTSAHDAPCRPSVKSPLPLRLGDLPAGGTLTAAVTVDFSGCARQARFTIAVQLAGSGAAHGEIRRNNDYAAASAPRRDALRPRTPLVAPALSLTPGGALSGQTGTAVGWGFTIANTSGAWIEITSANFCEGTSGTTTACTSATLGTFSDLISAFNDIVVGPSPDSTSVSQVFNQTAHTGIGSFLISAPSGSTGSAQIVLTYNVFSRSPHDPAFNPETDTVSTDNFLTAGASVTVSGPTAPSPIPTLSAWALAGLGMLLAAAGAWLMRGQARAE